jgi:hypothetical protein
MGMGRKAKQEDYKDALIGDGAGLNSPMKYTADEWPGVHAQKARLAERMRHVKDDGWDGRMVHESKIDWPLSKAMLQDGNHELLRTAIKYRTIHEQATAEPLLGEGSVPAGELVILHRLSDRGDGTMISSGEVVLKTAAPTEFPAQRSTPTSSESKQKASPIPKPWNGDRAVNDAIDARDLLARLRSRLGPLVEPLERAVIDGDTIQKVGGASGIRGRDQSIGAGKALIYTGLIIIRDYLQSHHH